jgi:hypothetical protein
MSAYRVILRVVFWVILGVVLVAASFWVYAIVTGRRPLSGTTLMVSRARLGSRVGDLCRSGAAVSWPQGARTSGALATQVRVRAGYDLHSPTTRLGADTATWARRASCLGAGWEGRATRSVGWADP